MKRFLLTFNSIILLFFSLFFLCQCNKPGDGMIYFSNKRPDNLVPILNMNEESRYLSELIFDGLVNKTTLKNGREQYQWALVAENGYREEDAWNRKLITFYLRKGVLWHDGREFTAKDVIYTFKAIKNSDSPLKDWLDSFIEEIIPVEGNNYKLKVRIKVERSKEAFMELFSPIKIMPHRYHFQGQQQRLPENLNDGSAIGQEFKFRPVGTGPYKIAQRETQERILLAANEAEDYSYYLQESTATPSPLKTLTMEVEKDPIKAVKELKKGMGLIFDVKQEFFPLLDKAPLKSQSYLPYSFYAILYNTTRAPLDKLSFRRAVTCATDKSQLAATFIRDPQTDARKMINNGIFPTGCGYVSFAPDGFPDMMPYDPDTAKQLLESAGTVSNSFGLTICSGYDGSWTVQLAHNYKKMMAAVGIQVEIHDLNPRVFDQKLKEGDYDAVFYRFAGFDHFYDIRPLFGNGAFNFWQVRDPQLESLLTQFGMTLAWEKRVALAKQIHTAVSELSPGCFLFTVPRRAYYSGKLSGVTVHPEVGFSTVENWQFTK